MGAGIKPPGERYRWGMGFDASNVTPDPSDKDGITEARNLNPGIGASDLGSLAQDMSEVRKAALRGFPGVAAGPAREAEGSKTIVDAAAASQLTYTPPPAVIVRRPEPDLLRALNRTQDAQSETMARMASGIETLAVHAEAQAKRAKVESTKTSWIIALSAVGAGVGLILVILTVALLHHH